MSSFVLSSATEDAKVKLTEAALAAGDEVCGGGKPPLSS